MIRKSISDSREHLTAAQLTVREKQESKVFSLGMPLCPNQYIHNNKPLCAQWKKYAKWLLDKRLLSFADGAALLELSEAEIAGQKDRKAKALAHWKNRAPFPAEVIAGSGIENFIAKVREERESFPERLRPDSTLTLELDSSEFDWPEGDAATIAKQFAQWAVSSSDTGELIKRAADKFLRDLEEGHRRGIFFDAVAVRNVVTFMKDFGGLPEILPWEVWVLAAIFGFKRASGLRVITEAHLSMGRKNGKTRLAASIGLFMMIADLEKYAEVYVCATAKIQSRICWRDAKRVVGDNPELIAHVKRFAGELHIEKTDSKMEALASEERSFLGVRASAIVCDELGLWQDRNAYDAITQSTVSRSQPLTISITTAPEHKQTFCHEKFSWCEKILRGIVSGADHVFTAIWRLDDADDVRSIVALRKANPSLGTSVLPETQLLKQIGELADSPSGLSNWLQFHCNQTPERSLCRQGSITAKKWDACGKQGLELIGETDCLKATAKFLAMNEDSPCYLGLDIGLKNDLTALALLFPKARFSDGAEPIDKRVLVVQCYAPEDGLLEKERLWQVPLSTWARSAFLTLLPGDLIDLRTIKEAVVDFCTRFKVYDIGADPWQFTQQAAELNESGITCTTVPVVPSQMTAPCQALMGDINRADLIHFSDPCLTWQMGNVVFEESDRHSGIKPDKLSPAEKIDGVSATVMAYHRMLSNPVRNFKPMFLFDDPNNPGALIEIDPLTKKEIK